MAHELPTKVHYRVIGVCSLMSLLLYLDRFCVSFAEAFIKEDLRISATGISVMFGAFFVSYALGQTPSGWLADRFGGRRTLTCFIVAWSLFTAALGLADGVVLLVILRFGMGFAQAGAYPTAASLISKWVPLTQRGFASSIVALGGRVGGVLSMLITGFVILFFVPATMDSAVQPSDLLAPEKLCYELRFGDTPPEKESGSGGVAAVLGGRILARVSELDRTEFLAAAESYRQRVRSSQSGVAVPAAAVGLEPRLAAALNGALRDPQFVRLDELRDVKLEREATRLLSPSAGPLESQDLQRANRLVLEAVYPTGVKKIYGLGWRKMTFVYGLAGIPVAFLFWWVCRDEPRKHTGCNAAELAQIEANRPAVAGTTVGKLPFRELATNGSMWCNGAMQFLTNVGWVFLLTYLPRYLLEVHHIPVANRAWMATVPTLFAIVGMFCGGFVTDRLAVAWGRRWGRSLPIALTRWGAAAAYLVCLTEPSPWVSVGVLSVAAFFCDLGIPAVWAFQQDVGGKHAGSVLGWGNMWGNFGAAVGPYIIARIAGDGQNWSGVFLACAGAFILSGAVALGVDSRRQISS